MKSLVTEEPGVESPVDGRVRAIRDKAAGSIEVARGVRKAQEAALEDFPGPVDSRNAAVLEKLEKNGAFATLAGEGGVADNSAEVARKATAGGVEELIVEPFVEALEEEKCQTS